MKDIEVKKVNVHYLRNNFAWSAAGKLALASDDNATVISLKQANSINASFDNNVNIVNTKPLFTPLMMSLASGDEKYTSGTYFTDAITKAVYWSPMGYQPSLLSSSASTSTQDSGEERLINGEPQRQRTPRKTRGVKNAVKYDIDIDIGLSDSQEEEEEEKRPKQKKDDDEEMQIDKEEEEEEEEEEEKNASSRPQNRTNKSSSPGVSATAAPSPGSSFTTTTTTTTAAASFASPMSCLLALATSDLNVVIYSEQATLEGSMWFPIYNIFEMLLYFTIEDQTQEKLCESEAQKLRIHSFAWNDVTKSGADPGLGLGHLRPFAIGLESGEIMILNINEQGGIQSFGKINVNVNLNTYSTTALEKQAESKSAAETARNTATSPIKTTDKPKAVLDLLWTRWKLSDKGIPQSTIIYSLSDNSTSTATVQAVKNKSKENDPTTELHFVGTTLQVRGPSREALSILRLFESKTHGPIVVTGSAFAIEVYFLNSGHHTNYELPEYGSYSIILDENTKFLNITVVFDVADFANKADDAIFGVSVNKETSVIADDSVKSGEDAYPVLHNYLKNAARRADHINGNGNQNDFGSGNGNVNENGTKILLKISGFCESPLGDVMAVHLQKINYLSVHHSQSNHIVTYLNFLPLSEKKANNNNPDNEAIATDKIVDIQGWATRQCSTANWMLEKAVLRSHFAKKNGFDNGFLEETYKEEINKVLNYKVATKEIITKVKNDIASMVANDSKSLKNKTQINYDPFMILTQTLQQYLETNPLFAETQLFYLLFTAPKQQKLQSFMKVMDVTEHQKEQARQKYEHNLAVYKKYHQLFHNKIIEHISDIVLAVIEQAQQQKQLANKLDNVFDEAIYLNMLLVRKSLNNDDREGEDEKNGYSSQLSEDYLLELPVLNGSAKLGFNYNIDKNTSYKNIKSTNGIIWQRCGISLLPLLEPKVRHCEVCETKYLDSSSMSDSKPHRSKQSLKSSRVLSAMMGAVSRCVYCGGKLVLRV